MPAVSLIAHLKWVFDKSPDPYINVALFAFNILFMISLWLPQAIYSLIEV